MVVRKKKIRRSDWPYWDRFMPERSTNNRNTRESFITSFVSISVPGSITDREVVTRIVNASKYPVAIEALPNELDTTTSARGSVHFGFLGNILSEIAENFPNMRWWVSEKGLNMAIVPPDEMLPHFDWLAGSLCAKFWKDGGLSKTDLEQIARELDAQAPEMKGGFLGRFEPAARKRIGGYNQRKPKVAIRNFEQAVNHPRYAYLVRRLLYRARDKFIRVREAGFERQVLSALDFGQLSGPAQVHEITLVQVDFLSTTANIFSRGIVHPGLTL
jgi:hypothetical protein